MLSPETLEKRAQRAWPSLLKGELAFPWAIPLGSPRGRELLESFDSVLAWAGGIRRLAMRHGLRLVEILVRHRQLGEQSLPQTLIVEDLAAYLRWQKKEQLYRQWTQARELTLVEFPMLSDWIHKRTDVLEDRLDVWPQCLSVLRYFLKHPRPDRYVRELDIPGIDSKFIETHRPLLDQLLQLVLRLEPSGELVDSLRSFCRKYRLRFDPLLIRFRWLDPRLAAQTLGLSDLSVMLEEFQQLNPPVSKVFISENKTNVLSFPLVRDSLVIFGQGGGVGALAGVPWLRTKDIYYWGDIDTHGFAILAQFRVHFPKVRSFLMDSRILEDCRELWVQEERPRATAFPRDLLHENEAELYQKLESGSWGTNIRLEQERIPFHHVLAALEDVGR
ncbi:MAG TPA: Wadjet anti-phage system protein JetD domain-containing protein [Oligoflexus sp.]|uniref:Wadjet anti-phage system protein JetD domain-containing protein n=1 Tax=Oligoflexus sp. TaxID=1971216 RepID=UPI002D7E99A0|nr:Wadjet anti-phage system protein JetD domain-containing protein [Oligoflexus sp.]HET9239579.1 Wadjet anti-phage system protein JetD domain-containing protein [Oligoflexus sp.]